MSPKLIYSANSSGRWGMSVPTCRGVGVGLQDEGRMRMLPSGSLPSGEGAGKRCSGQLGTDSKLRTDTRRRTGPVRTAAVGRWGHGAHFWKPDPWIRGRN